MKTIKLTVLTLFLALITIAYAAEGGEKKEVTFRVACFDVGAAALQGRPGVISVQKGWNAGREINRVLFNPQKVSIASMESWLKSVGTYIVTESDLNVEKEKEKRQ